MPMHVPPSPGRLALLALAAAVLAAPLAGQRTERFALEGRRTTISNRAGEVRVLPGTGRDVVVEVTRRGRDAGQLRVVRDGGELRVVYPGDRVVYPRMDDSARATLEVRRDGALGESLWGTRRVTVAGTGAGTQAWADVRVLVPAGHRVSVYQGVGGVQVANVRADLLVRTRAAPVRVRGLRGELDVEARSGGVEVRDTEGEVTVSSSRGDVVLASVSGPLLDVATNRGAVSGSGLRVETVEVWAGNGTIRLDGVQAREVSLDNGTGGVTLGLAGDADLEIDTGSGGVVLSVPPSFGAQVAVRTGNGAIRVDLPVANRRESRGSLTGRVGDGNGSVEIETGNGAVHVRRN